MTTANKMCPCGEKSVAGLVRNVALCQKHYSGPLPNIERMVGAYLKCAEWADKPEGSNARFSKAAIAKARHDCAEFIKACGPLAEQAARLTNSVLLGHDFWLSRCGHGAGFWDRCELKVAPCCAVTAVDRDGATYDPSQQGDLLGDVLAGVAYGTRNHISRFAYPSLTACRGWLYFE